MTETEHRISLVVAVARNGVIGRDGDLPWRLRDDLKWFKEITLGKPIIMGRTTFDSIGKPLPGRENIVVTRQLDFPAPEGLSVAASLSSALTMADSYAATVKAEEICIVGGATIYEQVMRLVSRLYVTRIEANVEGDRKFDLPDPSGWEVTELATIEANEKNEYPATIMRWDRHPETARSPDAGPSL